MPQSWLIFALLSAVAASLVAIFGKMGLQGVDSNTATAIRAFIMTIFLVGVLLVEGKLSKISNIVSDPHAMLFIILSGIVGALSWLFYFLALNSGKVAQVVSIDRLSIVFAVVLAFLFLGEHISPRAGVGVAIMAVGAIIVALG
jgi:transporter family protein